jgi:uncharacterized protein YeaO (DUF488 family)
VTEAHVEVVRVYEDPGRSPGEHRVLVDRLWPRGLTKTSVDFDEWEKDVAPSTELRRWYGHDPGRFAEFARRYRAELAGEPGASCCSPPPVTSATPVLRCSKQLSSDREPGSRP